MEQETKNTKVKGGQNFNELSVTMYGETYKWDSLPETQQHNCGVYGLALKLGRTTAGMNKDVYNDKERSKAVKECWEHLKENHWNKPGTGKGGVKKADLEAKVVEQSKTLEKMEMQLAEAQELITKLTKKTKE